MGPPPLGCRGRCGCEWRGSPRGSPFLKLLLLALLGKALCHTQELPGAWVKGQSAGGCRNNSGFPSNPKFWLRVSEPSEVFAAVLQRPRVCAAGRAGRARAPVGDGPATRSPASFLGEDYQAVGLHIWKVTLPWAQLPAQGLGLLGHERLPGASPTSSSGVARPLDLPQPQLRPAGVVGQREMKQKDWQEGGGHGPV